MKFYDRENELELMELLGKKKPGFLVITGRRRVGKTELIKEFIRGKKALYYFVDSNKSIEVLLREFSQYTAEMLKLPSYVKIDSPESLVEFIFTHGEIVVVFDEFQRFQKIYHAFITQLQKNWDIRGKESKVFLIVSGSSVGMIKKIFIAGGAPLFKRADNIITLKPFKAQQILTVLDDLGIKELKEKLNLYFLFGGTIYYYRLLEKYECKNLADALKKLIFNDLAPLQREMSDVLIEEFGKEHATYYEIFSAIADGKAKQKEIADHTHISASSLPPYLDELINILDLVEHRVPVTEEDTRSKKGRYFLKDNFFRFYARFIYRNMSLYKSGRYDLLMEKTLSEWSTFSGWAFEEMVQEILREEFSGEYERIGSWWNRRGDEIDLLALSRNKGLAVEINNTELSIEEALNIIEELKEKRELVKGINAKITFGVAARKLEGKNELRDQGYFAWDLDDLKYSE